MRDRIARVRLWLVAGGLLLLLVLATFIGSARYLARKFRLGKAATLAANIKSALKDVSYTHSSLGVTEYTIHAGSEVDYKDGKISLHDVSMVLYGKKHDRADHIYGKEFEYDQANGLVRAIGLVHIDMQAAETASRRSPADDPGPDAKVLHATTSGLVYMDKLGVAATGEPIEFQLGGMTGHATGADYSTDSGQLMLHSAVRMDGVRDGRAMTLTAASAQLDDRNRQAFLTRATYTSMGRSVAADQATVHTRADGTLARIEAQGSVTSAYEGARLVSGRGDVLLDAKSEPQSALLSGGVTYASDAALRQMRGQADAATVTFLDGAAEHAVFTGSVHGIERTRASEDGKEPWSVRDLVASRVELALAPGARGQPDVREVNAAGSAHLALINEGTLASVKGAGRTDVMADDLKAHLVPTGEVKRPTRLDTLSGVGHTVLRQVAADGLEQTSTGDTLDARFRASAGAAAGMQTNASGTELLSAVQGGHVTVLRRTPAKPVAKPGAKPGQPGRGDDTQRGLAERATYDGTADRLTLSGAVQLSDSGSALWANEVSLDHASGDASAHGSVKVNYVQLDAITREPKPAAEPTHIQADRAELNHREELATFYGSSAAAARLWQGGTQVQAPVIEFYQQQRRMVARSEGAGGANAVHAVLVTAGGVRPLADQTSAAKPSAKKADSVGRLPQVARITSGEMVYTDVPHQVEFTGGVRVDDADGVLLARQATAFLQPGPGSGPATTAPGTSSLGMDGQLERVVATGHVGLSEPGRRATGERLEYTESEGLYVLTGMPGAMPKVVDAERGTTVTGPRLEFHAGDESVVVAGEKGSSGQRVRTDSRVKP